MGVIISFTEKGGMRFAFPPYKPQTCYKPAAGMTYLVQVEKRRFKRVTLSVK
jgi:hypothetical protein